MRTSNTVWYIVFLTSWALRLHQDLNLFLTFGKTRCRGFCQRVGPRFFCKSTNLQYWTHWTIGPTSPGHGKTIYRPTSRLSTLDSRLSTLNSQPRTAGVEVHFSHSRSLPLDLQVPTLAGLSRFEKAFPSGCRVCKQPWKS